MFKHFLISACFSTRILGQESISMILLLLSQWSSPKYGQICRILGETRSHVPLSVLPPGIQCRGTRPSKYSFLFSLPTACQENALRRKGQTRRERLWEALRPFTCVPRGPTRPEKSNSLPIACASPSTSEHTCLGKSQWGCSPLCKI